MNFREEGEVGSKSREEGEIGSESREKGDSPPCSTPSKIGDNYIVLGKVKHSQRMNDPCVTL